MAESRTSDEIERNRRWRTAGKDQNDLGNDLSFLPVKAAPFILLVLGLECIGHRYGNVPSVRHVFLHDVARSA
jgi:hypothetical protein